MALVGYIGSATEVVYDTEGTQSGLTDLTAKIFNPSNTSGTPDFSVVLTEIGATGIYRGSFTPTLAGSHVVCVGSVLSSPVIDDKGGRIFVAANSEADVIAAVSSAETNLNTAISTAETNIITNTDNEIAAIAGAGFNSATDSLEGIRNEIDSISTVVGTPGARGKVL